jgi:glycosyltransferase involved in cell wall biosynthesis
MPARFTIAIPTHDRRDTVILALRSALAQTRTVERVLVLCDGCTDGTAAAVAGLGDARATAVELPKGAGYAYGHRNLVLEDAHADDVVLWLADDDLLLPDHLDRLGEVWDADPSLVMVTAPATIVHEDDTLEWLARDWAVPAVRTALLERENHCPMAAVSVRPQAARAAGGWDAGVTRQGDRDLWVRILADDRARVRMTYEPTVLHFRATGRDQPWADRVAQNTAWLARLQDPRERSAVQDAMRAARAAKEGDEYAQLVALYAAQAQMQTGVADLRAQLERAIAEREELRARLLALMAAGDGG